MDFKQVSKDYSIEKETKHWWFSTRFNFIEKSLGLIDSQKIKVIEYGCGTGQNLYFICNKSKHKNKITQLTGIDENFEWTNIWDWTKKFPKIEILKKLIKNEKYNFLICMDVLEHIENDLESLKLFVNGIEKNSLVLITVPAFQKFWTNHDEILKHKRRYNKEQLLELARNSGLKEIEVKYFFSFLHFLFPILKIFLNKKNITNKINNPNYLINIILKLIGKIEFFLGGSNLFGTSVIGVFRKN